MFDREALSLAGCCLLRRPIGKDARGTFRKIVHGEAFAAMGLSCDFVEQYVSTSAPGVLRGMHFQTPPFGEMKLVTCLAGRILDVAVDLRKGSSTFLRHVAVELSAENACSFLILQGFAHGFQTLTDDVTMIYAHSAPYRAEAEGGLSPTDPRLAIQWPLPVAHLSPRDAAHPLLGADYRGLAV